PARPGSQGRKSHDDTRGALPACAGALPAGLGRGQPRHHPVGAAGTRDRDLPGVRSGARRGDARDQDQAPGPGRRLFETPEAFCASVRPVRSSGNAGPDPGQRRPQHPPLRSARGGAGMNMQKPFASTLALGSSLANKTGSWRTERPVYVDRLPPCNAQCPAGEDIQGWLFHAESGHYETAWRHLTLDNPFPATMGRVCYHTCERACNRGKLDEAVGINSVEHFLGDEALKRGWQFEAPHSETGKHVLVVGAGPSGMSAAYHLRRLGHSVTVKEAGPAMGGMMRFGIPKYRLPREVLDAEMQRIVAMGVKVELNAKVAHITEDMKAGGFDAAFLAVGAHIAKRAFIPAKDSSRIMDAVAVLRSMEGEDKPMLGRRVVVYGGGNTAIDVARTAKRLGATEAVIVYRRTREKMPAHDFEVEEALQEGVM